MRARTVAIGLFLPAVLAAPPAGAPRETRVPVAGASLYAREIGSGPPILVLHGGPDFDCRYLLPDFDRLADGYRLLYYDQRGRGRSADGVRPEDVSLASDVADLDRVREHFRLDAATVLGHSWGAVLALEYAIRHPERVSRLILMNPAPVSAADFQLFRKERAARLGKDLERLNAIRATAAFQAGDPDAVAAYYRIHFKPALARAADLERLMAVFAPTFTAEGVLKARAVEDRLMKDTWLTESYDLLPRLAALKMPALVIGGDHDFIPAAAVEHIAHALPNARLVTLTQCGHFPYLECPEKLRPAIDAFFRGPAR